VAKTAHVCLVEVVPLEGCELDPSEFAGAMARCYVFAENAEEAKRLVGESLVKDRFAVVEFEWCVADRETDWENPHSSETDEMIKEAESSGDVVYGRFDSWGHDADE